MQIISRYHIAQAVLTDNQDLYHRLETKLQALSLTARDDFYSIPSLFPQFCHAFALDEKYMRRRRTRATNALVEPRRLFIAIVLVMYDPLWMNRYSVRMRDTIRWHLSTTMNVHEIWVSQVADSIRFEYYNLSTFRMQVDMLIYWLNGCRAAA